MCWTIGSSMATVGRLSKKAGVVSAVAGVRFPPLAAFGGAAIGVGVIFEAAGTVTAALAKGEHIGDSFMHGARSVFKFD